MGVCEHSPFRALILSVLAFSIPTICVAQSRTSQVSPAAIYEHAHSSVVVVIVGDKNSNPIGQGSGFIVATNRVATNHHVIKDVASALVVFADGSSELVEGIAADSVARDLVILVVKTGSRPVLKLGDELTARQGDSVYALGAPRGLALSLTNGIVSGFRDVDDQFLLQTTAPIAPGSSGGPLFDSSGRVIGVTTALLADSPGIYFSIGARDVSRLLRSPSPLIIALSTEIPRSTTDAAGAPPPVNTDHGPTTKVEGGTQAARLINKTQPVYPPLARQLGISGTVRLHATVTKDGHVGDIEPVSGHPLLGKAAMDAVRQWVYQPTLLNGESVEVDTTIDVIFSLNQ
jgi:TonB family protein